MIGTRLNIKTSTDGSLYEVLTLNTTQDITDWSFFSYLHLGSDENTALLILTVTKDITNKKIILEKSRDDLIDIYDLYKSGLKYNVLCKPETTNEYQFFYGKFEFVKGGPKYGSTVAP
jgi:hypothetical protein